jgi:starvation-inducible DNA-binding protein
MGYEHVKLEEDPMHAEASLGHEEITKIAKELDVLLADLFTLYVKTLHCHWNVKDPRFISLHELFETIYTQLQPAIDEIAERIQQLGKKAPASMKEFLELTTQSEIRGKLNGDQMIRTLFESHQEYSEKLRSGIDLTTELNDQGTADLLIQTLRMIDKNAWMLRQHLTD